MDDEVSSAAAEAARDVRSSMQGLAKAGPIQLIRIMKHSSKQFGSNSMSYHTAQRYNSLANNQTFTHFASGKAVSRRSVPEHLKKLIGICHDHVLKEGHPVTLSELVPVFRSQDEKATATVMNRVRDYGVQDEFLIPVYGPFRINAVISFGFPHDVRELEPWKLELLESIATYSHNKIVRHFISSESDIDLSNRENEILNWIARGKSKSEISQILDLQPSSVDTYTRRIFRKLGVNDRVSAAVSGLIVGAVS